MNHISKKTNLRNIKLSRSTCYVSLGKYCPALSPLLFFRSLCWRKKGRRERPPDLPKVRVNSGPLLCLITGGQSILQSESEVSPCDPPQGAPPLTPTTRRGGHPQGPARLASDHQDPQTWMSGRHKPRAAVCADKMAGTRSPESPEQQVTVGRGPCWRGFAFTGKSRLYWQLRRQPLGGPITLSALHTRQQPPSPGHAVLRHECSSCQNCH